MARAVVGLVVVVVAVGGYVVGRRSATNRPRPGTYADGYRAGREDAFSGFDGGWAFDEPYIVILRHAGEGITYRIARRWPVLPGREYRSCRPQLVCSR